MEVIMLLLSLLGLFASLTAANIERSCDCVDDACVAAQGPPPYNTSCIVTVPIDAGDTDTNDTSYAYQACGNASFADMSGIVVSDEGVRPPYANTSNCIRLLKNSLDPATHSFVFLASQLYNTSVLPVATYDDCYLWLLGGENATKELTDVYDTFFVGNMDLVLAVGHSIINYGNDLLYGVNSNISVCGTIPNCGFYNTRLGTFPPAPEFAFCIGGLGILEYWAEDQGSLRDKMVKFEDLPSEQLRVSRAVHPRATVPEPTKEEPSSEDESLDLLKTSDLETRARRFFIRCDVGDKSLAECTQLHDTYCDNDGRLHSDDVTCRFDCSCIPVPNAHCGLHYGFIYDCYHEDTEDNMVGASIDTLELSSVIPPNSSMTEEGGPRLDDE